MKCNECEGLYVEKRGPLEVQDPYLDTIIVDADQYFQCANCASILFAPQTARALEQAREEATIERLKRFPISEFVTASEAAALLGVTRQAFHKNKRVNHGFIFRICLGTNLVYLRKSVLLFRDTGDGRFPLSTIRTHKHPVGAH